MSSPITHETIIMNISPAFKCWKLLYNLSTKRVVGLFESAETFRTAQELYCSSPTDGTTPGFVSSEAGRDECEGIITGLGLIPFRSN